MASPRRKRKSKLPPTALLAMAATALFAAGCDEVPALPGQTGVPGECTSIQAQIAIRDGYMQTLCGCQEGATDVVPPASLSCTVAKGTVVFFWYFSPGLTHQIIPTGSPSFPPSPVSIPGSAPSYPVHAVTFTDAGNYTFEDAYQAILNGTIVVH